MLVIALSYSGVRASDNPGAVHNKAIELDPTFASAYGMASRCYSMRKSSGWMDDRQSETEQAARLARRAASLGKNDAIALSTAGIGLAFVAGHLDEGGELIANALRLDPNLSWGWLFNGWVKVWKGEAEEALPDLEKAMRLSPNDPHICTMQAGMAMAHYFAGRYNEALVWARRAMLSYSHTLVLAVAVAAVCAARCGESAEAQKAMELLAKLDPNLRISNLNELFPLKRQQDKAMWREGLRQAGLPE